MRLRPWLLALAGLLGVLPGAGRAVARSVLVAIYHILERGIFYEELGNDYFDRLNAKGVTRYHVGRLKSLGFSVTLAAADQDGDEQAA